VARYPSGVTASLPSLPSLPSLRTATWLATWLLLGWAILAPAKGVRAQPLAGDLNGDGRVDSTDETWLSGFYGASRADAGFEPAADLTGDGRVDHRDLAVFGNAYGRADGSVDSAPPDLLVTLNHIPDDQNDSLVVPPEGFQITMTFHSAGGSALDTSSLSVTSDQPTGDHAAGTELAELFEVTPTGAVFQVPTESDLPRTSHNLRVSVSDLAGNTEVEAYGFAVRDFELGPPLGDLQILFLDFDQDRSLGGDVDFVEDLRSLGLGSPAAPNVEAIMRERLTREIVSRAHSFYGRDPDGRPGADAANVFFVSSPPSGTYARLCVGGESSLGPSFLGSSTLDPDNLLLSEDECEGDGWLGVFPQALDDVWGGSREFQATFHPLMPSRGGTPVGEDRRDGTVTAAGFDASRATAEELVRWLVIENAVDAFAAAIGAVVSHEAGHLLGLVTHGPAPGGLYGGSGGPNTDHNVTAQGETPSQNFLMNAGATFSFDAITGRNGFAPPAFRALSWAYLRDRVISNPPAFIESDPEGML